jgi:hypothetical protein
MNPANAILMNCGDEHWICKVPEGFEEPNPKEEWHVVKPKPKRAKKALK